MRSLRYRAHTWAADRFRGVQYPRERATAGGGLRWKYAMPLWQRFAYVLLFSAMTVFGLGVIAFIAFMLWGLFIA